MTNMPFNTNAPMTMPMIDGYYNGEKVFFVHTEVSDKDMDLNVFELWILKDLVERI